MEAIVAVFKALCQHLLCETEEYFEKLRVDCLRAEI
jgi:hypothetical protein